MFNLVLHPRYKLRYFEKLGWNNEWIKIAEGIVRDEFKCTYKDYAITKTVTARSSTKKKVGD
jgi:hypothetical protein